VDFLQHFGPMKPIPPHWKYVSAQLLGSIWVVVVVILTSVLVGVTPVTVTVSVVETVVVSSSILSKSTIPHQLLLTNPHNNKSLVGVIGVPDGQHG